MARTMTMSKEAQKKAEAAPDEQPATTPDEQRFAESVAKVAVRALRADPPPIEAEEMFAPDTCGWWYVRSAEGEKAEFVINVRRLTKGRRTRPAPRATTTIPRYELDGYTKVLDQANGVEIMIEGIVPLPVGATVQLGNPNRDAKVIGSRLLVGPHGRATLVLDVDVTAVN